MIESDKFAARAALACLLLVGLALNGCGRNQNAPQGEAGKAAPTQTAPVEPAKLPPPPGYSLQVPGKWATAKVQVRTLEDTAASALVPYARRVVEYLYEPMDKQFVAQPLMLIVVMTQTDWDKTRAMPGPELGKLLGSSQGYVYVLSLPQVSPYAKDSQDTKIFRDLMVDETSVSKTFSLAK